MATVRPARTFWKERASTADARWVYWIQVPPFIELNDGVHNFFTRSGSGTKEYYYTGPSLSAKPEYVKLNELFADEGTLGALVAGEWAWGDNDSLGADTLYVRLADSTDPDTKTAGWVKATQDDGTEPVFDSVELMVGSKEDPPITPGDREERYRMAIRFAQPTAPSWTGDGPIAGVGSSLLLICDSASVISSPVLEVAVIGAAWTDATTAAEFRVIAVTGSWYESTRVYGGHGAPQALYIDSLPGTAANGYIIRTYDVLSTDARMTRFSTIPVPLLLRHYQYTASSAARVDATERADLSTTALAILQDRAEYRRFSVAMTALLSETDPLASDVSITPAAGTLAIARLLNWPETWQPDIPAAGGLPLSLVSDTVADLSTLRGALLETVLSVIDKTGASHTVLTQGQIIGDLHINSDASGELELRSPIDSVLSAIVCNTHPAAPATVEYDEETVITVIADVLLNSGRWLYKRFHYNDIAELHSRFAGIWTPITLSTSDLTGLSVKDVLELCGPALGVCVSQSADGCIDLWHPGVYRPSRRTHYIADTDCTPGGCRIVDRGRDGQYAGVTVDDGATSTVYSITEIPTDAGWRENLFTVTVPDDLFDTSTRTLSRMALGRQLAQRLCERRYEIELEMGLKGMAVDVGDTVVLTSAQLGSTIPCLVTSVSSDTNTGVTVINAVHYPDALGLHSTWEDDGVLGIWRWIDSDLASDYSNMAHGVASDGDFTPELADPETAPLTGHWQGRCAAFAVSNDPLLQDSVGVSDMFDVCVLIGGDMNAPSGWDASWTDPDKGPLLAWVNADDSALVLFWDVPDGAGSPSQLDNRLAIGYTTDYTTNPVVWEWVYYLPYGAIGRADQGTNDATILPSAIALEWQDTTIRIYVERRLMLEIDEDEADKADYASATLYLNRASTNLKLGCFRHIRQTGWITELQRLQGANGIDPYYGPDSLD